MRGSLILLGVLAVTSACGDDDDVAAIDAGVTIDAPAVPDASAADAGPECTSFLDCEDPLKLECDVDAGVCVQCLEDDHCDLYFFTHVCDVPARGCVECLTTADCEADPTALGTTCNEATKFCTCAGPADCADNPNGAVCDVDLSACSCETVDDCGPGQTCEPSDYLGEGKRTCVDS